MPHPVTQKLPRRGQSVGRRGPANPCVEVIIDSIAAVLVGISEGARMRRSTTGIEEPRQQRFTQPWSINPWFNSRSIGPHPYRGVDSQQQHVGLAVSLHAPPAYVAALVEPGESRERQRKDKRQQRTALSIWDGEGGR
jgi:hypothetical protein